MIRLYFHDRIMLFDYNNYGLADCNDGSEEDLRMLDGEEEYVPVFVDLFTLYLEHQDEVEEGDAVNNKIMVVAIQEAESQGMRAITAVSVTALSVHVYGWVGARGGPVEKG